MNGTTAREHRISAACAGALLVALGLCPSTAAGRDVVKLKDGSTFEGKITALAAAEVRIEADGKPQAFPNADVMSFALDDAPPSVRQGDTFSTAGDFERAIGAYQAALSDVSRGRARGLHRPLILQKLARAHRAHGNIEAALTALGALRAEGRDTRLYADSFRDSIEAARQRKERTSLETVLAVMEQESEPLASAARLERGKMRLEMGDAAGAREIFESLLAAKGMPHTSEARAWSLRALRRGGGPDEIEAACRAAIESDGSSPSLLQTAHALLGEAQLESARKGTAGAARESFLAFARALAQGPSSGEGNPEDYARALLGAARASALLSSADAPPEARRHYRIRAQGYLREATRTFKGTPWAKEASDELARLGE